MANLSIPSFDAWLTRDPSTNVAGDGFGDMVDDKTDDVLAFLELGRANIFPNVTDSQLRDFAYSIAETQVDEAVSSAAQDAAEARL